MPSHADDPNYLRCAGHHSPPLWIHIASANFSCYNENDGYCRDCWNDRGGCDCSDCTGEANSDDDEYSEGEEVDHCHSCGTSCLHLDLLVEIFVCDCGAKAFLSEDPDRPILFHARSPLAKEHVNANL